MTLRATEVSAWLSIPLSDYEGHMNLPDVAQGPALASELEVLLRLYRPSSLALLGCAGGNGLERVDPAVTRRVVAVDLNPAYMAATQLRFGQSFQSFEPIVCDIGASDSAPFPPVDLIFAGLLLEYVPLIPAMRFIRSGLEAGGIFTCVTQQESESLPRVSPSPFTTLTALSDHMRALSPEEVQMAARTCGLRKRSLSFLQMPNGKVLVSQTCVAQSTEGVATC